MRQVFALCAALCFALPAAAQQSGTVGFDVPNTCVVAGTFAPNPDPVSTCAPASYRVYRDDVSLGAIAPGGSISFPADGTFVVGIEPVGARGPGPRVNRTVVVGTIPTVPGPVRNFTITLACATTSPPTCTATVTETP